MNKADSEKIALTLKKKGWRPAEKKTEADLIIVNMCSVRQSAVDRIFGLAQNLAKLQAKKPQLKTILTGCLLKQDEIKFRTRFDRIVNKSEFLKAKVDFKKNSPALVPISNGCSNYCSYCVVPLVRGPLRCYSHQKIINQIKSALRQKVKEVWLLGQNVNDYQSPLDKKINFSRLIKMIDRLPTDFKFFFVSPHPKNFSDELIKTLSKAKKFGRYINLPLQSGDSRLLKKMNRNYTAKDYEKIAKKIRKAMPDIRLSTDIIVGFPGENEKQFKNTAKMVEKIKFDQAYIAKYSSRPGTTASRLPDNVSWAQKKKREQTLRQLIDDKSKTET